MVRPPLEVADVFAAYAEDFFKSFGDDESSARRRVARDIIACRTAALGGHIDRCDRCDYEKISYNSCRNRHCPKCQGAARAKWLEGRAADLLPVEYFHVVFTVPAEIAGVALQNKKVMYDILLRTSAETLKEIAADPKHLGARIGGLCVLHTWGQRLMHHPHAHYVVPGGGLSPEGDWVSCRPGFFLPVGVLRKLFRGKFLDATRRAYGKGELEFQGHLTPLQKPDAFASLLRSAYETNWMVYAKPPFGGPEQVLKYLAGYTHRVAISNRRLLSFEGGRVSFVWKDYARGNRRRKMTLDAVEFIRRFLLHVLPKRFVRIRHFGLFANTCRAPNLERARALITDPTPRIGAETGAEIGTCSDVDSHRCPQCEDGRLIRSRLTAGDLRLLSESAPRRQPALIDTS